MRPLKSAFFCFSLRTGSIIIGALYTNFHTQVSSKFLVAQKLCWVQACTGVFLFSCFEDTCVRIFLKVQYLATLLLNYISLRYPTLDSGIPSRGPQSNTISPNISQQSDKYLLWDHCLIFSMLLQGFLNQCLIVGAKRGCRNTIGCYLISQVSIIAMDSIFALCSSYMWHNIEQFIKAMLAFTLRLYSYWVVDSYFVELNPENEESPDIRRRPVPDIRRRPVPDIRRRPVPDIRRRSMSDIWTD